MRFFLAIVLSLLPGFSHAQGDRPWYETNEDIALLHRPQKSFRFSLGTRWFDYLLAADPVTVARVYSKRPPISLKVQPAPELAGFITSPDRHITEKQFGKLSLQADRLLQTFDDIDPDAQDRLLWDLHAHGLSFTPAADHERDHATELLAGFAAVGRVFPIRVTLPMHTISVCDLKFHSKEIDSITPSKHIILINVQHPNERPCDCGLPPLPRINNRGTHARSIMTAYVEEMGHVFWRQMPQSQRAAFTSKLNLEDDKHDKAKLSAEHAFADAFVIAMLHPTTFETEHVESFQVLGLTPPSPPTGEFLEQIRFVDSLLDPIEQAFYDDIFLPTAADPTMQNGPEADSETGPTPADH